MDRNYFKDKYKINSARLSEWDYSWAGYYFFTICTKDRQNFFGEIRKGIMGLNELGCVVWQEWYRTARIRKNIRLDEFIVMPNHIHGIIEIVNFVETPRWGVSKYRDAAPQRLYNNKWKSNSLGSIINQIKSICTKRIRNSGHIDFSWQPRFHDHIIRIDTESLEKIGYYIRRNPTMWLQDKNNIDKIKPKEKPA